MTIVAAAELDDGMPIRQRQSSSSATLSGPTCAAYGETRGRETRRAGARSATACRGRHGYPGPAEPGHGRRNRRCSDPSLFDIGRGDGARAAAVRVRIVEPLPGDAPRDRRARAPSAGGTAHSGRHDDRQRAAGLATRDTPGSASRQPTAATRTGRADVAARHRAGRVGHWRRDRSSCGAPSRRGASATSPPIRPGVRTAGC